jgi:hypothetical protein
MPAMKAPTMNETERDEPSDGLWSEALWGLGLMGSVLLIVAVVSVLFGV